MTTEHATHTPGPWEARMDTGWITDEIGHTNIAMIAHDLGDSEEGPVGRANARLIAAAPALLAALEALRGDLLRYPNDDARREAIVDAADAALAQARDA